MAQNVRSNKKETAIEAALMAALKADGRTTDDIATTPKKPRRRVTRTRKSGRNSGEQKLSSNGRRREKSIVRKGIGWEHDIAEITISVDEADCGEAVAEGPYTAAKLFFDRHPEKGYLLRPKSLNVRMRCKTSQPHLRVWSVQSGTNIQQIDQVDLPHLMIPVEWKDGGPMLRKAHEDNCGIILMDDLGRFIHLEVGVTVRSQRNEDTGKFKWAIYLNLQEVFTGQVVRTTVARAKEAGLSYVPTDGGAAATVIPLWGYHNYPGNNWLGMNPAKVFGRETVVPTALAEGRSVRLSDASYEAWETPELGEPSGKNRVRGIVLWYNCAWNGGSGFVQLEDGNNLFLHWSQLRGGLYAPQPMSVVEFYAGEHRGKPQAKAVRAV